MWRRGGERGKAWGRRTIGGTTSPSSSTTSPSSLISLHGCWPLIDLRICSRSLSDMRVLLRTCTCEDQASVGGRCTSLASCAATATPRHETEFFSRFVLLNGRAPFPPPALPPPPGATPQNPAAACFPACCHLPAACRLVPCTAALPPGRGCASCVASRVDCIAIDGHHLPLATAWSSFDCRAKRSWADCWTTRAPPCLRISERDFSSERKFRVRIYPATSIMERRNAMRAAARLSSTYVSARASTFRELRARPAALIDPGST